jgi:hypothetical protein
MRNQINLHIARLRDLPVLRPNRNVVLEQGARLSATVETFLEFGLVRLQPPIDLPCAHGHEKLFLVTRELEVLVDPRPPDREQGFEAHRPRIAGDLPDSLKHADDFGIVGSAAVRAVTWVRLIGQGLIQFADGMFAVIAADVAHLVEEI